MKKDSKDKQEISICIYLTKKMMKQSMSEENKLKLNNIKATIVKQKNLYVRLFSYDIKMCETILNFYDYGINKNPFYKRKQPIDVDKVDVRKRVTYNKDSYGK